MDKNHRSRPKIKPRQVGNIAAAAELNEASASEVIDTAVLTMLKGLDPSDAVAFSAKIVDYRDRIGTNLKTLRVNLQANAGKELEDVAWQLSYNALMIGAMRIVSSSYELQSAIRCGDLAEAHSIADRLEMEYFQAQQALKKECEI